MEAEDPPIEAGPSTYTTAMTAPTPAPPPTTPAHASAPKTPRSTKKTPAQVLAEPAVPIPLDPNAGEDWGKRYELTLDTLDLAVRAGAQRWTYVDASPLPSSPSFTLTPCLSLPPWAAVKLTRTLDSAKDLEQCLPFLAAQHRKAIENVYLTSSHKMRSKIQVRASDPVGVQLA